MEFSTKQLRTQSGRIISHVNNGLDVTITYRGKPSARIIPITKKEALNIEYADDELFGIWKDRECLNDVKLYVRDLRKGRKLC